jgi:hypothetical protein
MSDCERTHSDTGPAFCQRRPSGSEPSLNWGAQLIVGALNADHIFLADRFLPLAFNVLAEPLGS